MIREGIHRFYRQCLDDGLTSKQAVFKTEGVYGVKRTLIMQIVSEGKEPK
jgi:hypothetical protein